ncbi:MAG: CaiB/BaiF CoA transferase family protein [Candidatus Binataceae bacterium]
MSLPLAGVRVIEAAQIYAGPYCALQLGHFGAEVIKIEAPLTGDFLRQRPPAPAGVNSGWLMFNPGKKSVTLNLRDARGRDILMRLLESADVMVENFAQGALERLGLGYEQLAPRFPRLIYASCKGYGSDSRWAKLGALDFTVQAASGIVSVTGYADRPGVRATAALIDTSTGVHLAAGVMAALIERGRSGRGRKVEVAMLDVTVPAVSGAIAAAREGRPALARMGNRHPSACPCNTYPAADGEIQIYCLTEQHWRIFARVIGRADLLADARYQDHASRYRIIEEVDALVVQWTRRYPRDDIVARLIAEGVPCAPVRTIDEVANDPELERRGLINRTEYPNRGEVSVLGSVIKLGEDGAAMARPPELGEHTAEILAALGISGGELEQLRRDGVI